MFRCRSCEKIQSVTQRRQGAKKRQEQCRYLLCEPLRLCCGVCNQREGPGKVLVLKWWGLSGGLLVSTISFLKLSKIARNSPFSLLGTLFLSSAAAVNSIVIFHSSWVMPRPA